MSTLFAITATKTTSTPVSTSGSTVSYSIQISNGTGVDATGVTITDQPENIDFTYLSSSVTLLGGAIRTSTVDPVVGDSPMSWSSFDIPIGGSVTIDVTMSVAAAVAAGVYNNSVNLAATTSGAITNYDGTLVANIAEDIILHQISPLANSLVINEVMYRANGNTSILNDEFIEIYNAGASSVDLTTVQLIDGNLVSGDLDGTSGSITGNVSSFNFVCTGAQVCSGSTTLAPGEYAVIWVGDSTNKDASGATFQAWLGQSQKLANSAEDLWLFGASNEFIDYIAWGSTGGSAVNTDYPAGTWDDAVQTSLDGVPAGTSISLTPNGADGDDSNCWEETASGDASVRCAAYIATVDTDTDIPIAALIASVGENNNLTLSADLAISKDDGETTYTPGGSFNYTLTVDNNGPDSANGAVIADDLPNWALSVTWTCASTGGAVCPNASGIGDLNETVATFPNGGQLVYTVSGTFSTDMADY